MAYAQRRSGYEPNGQSKYLDPRWQKRRLEILSRDNFTCQECSSTDKTLHVHHAFYCNSAEGPWDYPDEVLVTLCDECHNEWHDDIDLVKDYLFRQVIRLGYVTNKDLWKFVDTLERS